MIEQNRCRSGNFAAARASRLDLTAHETLSCAIWPLGVACAVVGLLAGSQAYADAADAAADNGQLAEITVTAQGRVENAQEVPISVAPITPDAALNAGAFSTDMLAQLVPGVQMGHEIDSATTFIRGIGPNSNGTGEESSVAVYLDDVYIPSGDASVFQLNAIAGIDVLKGPQGTLFGRNATGGVIQVHTKDPQFDPSADFEGGYGNYDTFTGNAYVTGKVIEDVASNLAVYITDQQNGWGHDVVTGQKAFTAEDWGIRNKWLWTPASSTKILLAGDFAYTRGEVGLGFNQIPQFVAAGGHGYCPGEGGDDGNPQTLPIGFRCPGARGATYVGWYNTSDNENDVSLIKHTTLELKAEQDFGFAKGVSITGWQNMTGFARFNQDSSAYGDVDTELVQRDRNLSQELRLISPYDASYASRFHWIVGAFYMDDNAGYGPNARLAGIAEGLPTALVPPSYYLNLTDNVRTTSIAGYMQGTALMAADTHLTLGTRYTVDKRLFTGGLWFSDGIPEGGGLPVCDAIPLACPTTPATPGASHRWPMGTYRVALDHEFADDVMGYVSWNRGVKSGQFDTFDTAVSGPANSPPVNPEVLKSVEAGMKGEWLDHHLQANLDAFHYDVHDLQLAIIVAGGTKLINAASAEVNGGELFVKVIPVIDLTLSGGLSILYGHYDSFKNAPDYFPPNAYYAGSNIALRSCTPDGMYTCNASGLDLIRAPHYGANFAADYVIPCSLGDFDLDANVSYTDSFYWSADESMRQPVVELLNAAVKWASRNGRYDLRLWGANLTGAEYYSFGSETIAYGQQFSPEPPRTFGITAAMHF
jgi:iron complex outermembrane recepter protein